MSRYETKDLLVQEALDELDISAKSELDGIEEDDELEDDLDGVETDIDVGIEDAPKIETQENDYGIKNISDQLDGMIEHWFEIAQSVPAKKKEAFLKLGDRLSELSDVLQSEFLDA